MNKSRLSPALAVLSGILLTVILIACQEDPATPRVPSTPPTLTVAPTPTPAPTATRVPAPTATQTPIATSAPTATSVPTPEEPAFTATTATTWDDAFATFTGHQQDCIRDALGQRQLDSLLRKTIMTSQIDDYSNLTVPLFSCLDPERAGSLYAGILALHFEEGMGLDLGDSEVTCLQVWATDKDVPRLLANEEADARILDEISICIAGPLEPLIFAQIEQSVGRLAREQEKCLEEVMRRYRHLLFRSYVGGGAPEGEAQRMTEELAVCVPELYEAQDEDTAEETVAVIVQEPQDFLGAHRIEPYLAGNLLFIAHWDEDAQRWLVHDVAGNFTPDQLTPPPGVAIPPNPEIGTLNELERGKLYDFHVRSDQIVNIVEEETGDWAFNSGANFIKWPR